MKGIFKNIALIVVTLCSYVSVGQNKQLLYNIDGLPQTLLVNPANDVTFDRHYGVPFLSQIHLNFGSTGVNTFDVFQDSQTSTLNSRITDILGRLTTDDFVEVNQQLEFFSIGFRNRKGTYFSAGLYQETDVISYIPVNFGILFYEGASGRNLNKPFSLDEIVAQGEALAVWHAGFSQQVNKKLRFGARIKVYSSLIDFRSTDNRGTFITTDNNNGPNIYRHSLIDANVKVQTSGFAELSRIEEPTPNDVISEFRKRIFFGGNLGFGADIGFTYAINDQLTVSGSAIDIGFISHYKDVETYRGSGSYDLDGIELDFPNNQGNDAPPYYENFKDEIEAAVPIDTLTTKYTTWRPLKLNAGLNYGFDNTTQDCNCYSYNSAKRYSNNVGLQLYTIKRPNGFHGAATAYFDKRLTKGLRAKVTYTVDKFSYSNVGALISAQGKKLNFYFGVDNLLDFGNLAKLNSVSLQLGLQFLITDYK